MTRPPALPLPMPVQLLLWIRHPLRLLDACQKWYGPTFRLRPFAMMGELRDVVVTGDPAIIRAMFSARPDEMHAGPINAVLRVALGESSVLLLDGREHLRHRKLLLPPFHGERMRLYGATMAEITRQAIERFPEGEAFALHPHMQEVTLQVILRTVFGAEDGELLEPLRAEIRGALERLTHPAAFAPMIYLSGHPEAEARAPWRWLLARRKRLDALLYRLIAKRRADPECEQRSDVLAMLMGARDEQGQPLSDRELRDELVTALAAGHETTATSLAWCVERVLSTPRVRDRLLDEVRAQGTDPDPEWLASLPYLGATLEESLRLRPVVPLVGRVLQKPHVLGGYELPAGTPLAACVYLAHHNPEVYPSPHEFRPERFLERRPDPASFLPFGGGIRRCVGAAFALYEMRIVLGTLLARCDLRLSEGRPERVVRRAVTLAPRRGTRVIATRRALGSESQGLVSATAPA